MAKATKSQINRSQRPRFIKAAREAECSEGEAAFDATLKNIGSYRPEVAMAKELKTSAELDKLLHERLKGFRLGSIPNPQWFKIVPADAAKEGANWKASHSSRTVPTGELSDVIEREMKKLQKLYDLNEKSAG